MRRFKTGRATQNETEYERQHRAYFLRLARHCVGNHREKDGRAREVEYRDFWNLGSVWGTNSDVFCKMAPVVVLDCPGHVPGNPRVRNLDCLPVRHVEHSDYRDRALVSDRIC